MIRFLPPPVRGTISFLIYLANTMFWSVPLFTLALLKLLIPINGWRAFCSKMLIKISNSWIFCNALNLKLMNRIQFDITGIEALKLNEWYLVVCNHQSWVDILILQNIFYRRIPFLKFFLKQELLWVPILGLAWWALDFPFMKRYSGTFLKKNPHLKGKDIEITRKACEKFKTVPISIMNFVEGTRFRPEKHKRQRSPYKYLLKPKAGGIGFVLAAMGDQLNSIVNVTIVYPDGKKTFWDFLCDKIPRISVNVEKLAIDEQIIGDYSQDREFRVQFQRWINRIWEDKDRTIEAVMSKQ